MDSHIKWQQNKDFQDAAEASMVVIPRDCPVQSNNDAKQTHEYCCCTLHLHVDTEGNDAKNVYQTRLRELRIAWTPRLARRGMMSFIYNAVKLYNYMKVMGKMIAKDDFKNEIKQIIMSWRK